MFRRFVPNKTMQRAGRRSRPPLIVGVRRRQRLSEVRVIGHE